MAKIPDQYRLTFKAQHSFPRDDNGDYLKNPDGSVIRKLEAPLAFAVAHEPSKKEYSKRCDTQDGWAYANCYVGEDQKMWWRGRHWHWNDSVIVEHDELVPEALQPRIIDNVPLDGFKIQSSVSRFSTANKLWRVLDPRGFELEITTGTLEDILLGGVIDRGLIVGPCIWKTAKMLVRVK